jgi:hypothetical protein
MGPMPGITSAMAAPAAQLAQPRRRPRVFQIYAWCSVDPVSKRAGVGMVARDDEICSLLMPRA